MKYHLLVSSDQIPTELKVVPITVTTDLDIASRYGSVAVECFILSTTGAPTIGFNEEPATLFIVNAGISVDNTVIDRITMSGSTVGFIMLFLIDINEGLKNKWIAIG